MFFSFYSNNFESLIIMSSSENREQMFFIFHGCKFHSLKVVNNIMLCWNNAFMSVKCFR